MRTIITVSAALLLVLGVIVLLGKHFLHVADLALAGADDGEGDERYAHERRGSYGVPSQPRAAQQVIAVGPTEDNRAEAARIYGMQPNLDPRFTGPVPVIAQDAVTASWQPPWELDAVPAAQEPGGWSWSGTWHAPAAVLSELDRSDWLRMLLVSAEVMHVPARLPQYHEQPAAC